MSCLGKNAPADVARYGFCVNGWGHWRGFRESPLKEECKGQTLDIRPRPGGRRPRRLFLEKTQGRKDGEAHSCHSVLPEGTRNSPGARWHPFLLRRSRISTFSYRRRIPYPIADELAGLARKKGAHHRHPSPNGGGWARAIPVSIMFLPDSDFVAFLDSDDVWTPDSSPERLSKHDAFRRRLLLGLDHGRDAFYYHSGSRISKRARRSRASRKARSSSSSPSFRTSC